MAAQAAQQRSSQFGTQVTTERELYLLIQHVAGAQIQELAVLLRPHGITPEQYHVLRVLKDSGKQGLACSAVADRSVSGDPDVTRLLDRLEKQGLVSRSRDTSDRRVVMARVTKEGKELLRKTDVLVADMHAMQFGTLDESQLEQFRGLLETVAQSR